MITLVNTVAQVAHPFLNPRLSTLQDSKFIYSLHKFPVGGELFAHLATAGFFNEEVIPRAFVLLWTSDVCFGPALFISIFCSCYCRSHASTSAAWSARYPFTSPSASFVLMPQPQVLFLECLHSRGYIFRNIKPESLLIDSEGHVEYECIVSTLLMNR
jgi:serine/threonine protein kinase